MEKLQGGIDLPAIKYTVITGKGEFKGLGKLIETFEGRAFFIVDSGIPNIPDLRQSVFRVPGGESVKTMEFAHTLIQRLVLTGIRRTDFLVVVGGGAVLDLAGMVAGLLFRGIRLVFCPTTATAMVDAAIGGKTGVDLPQGKNLLGMFKHADLIVADPEFLMTLNDRDLYAGLFEAVKTALLAGGTLWDFMALHADALVGRDLSLWSELVVQCMNFKMQVVSRDPLDQDRRHILNLGHTLGHALETITNFGVFRHGEAVIVGILAAIELSHVRGLLDSAIRDEILGLIGRLPLPELPKINVEALSNALDLDKKSGKWVLLSDIGRPMIVEHVSMAEIRSAFIFAGSFPGTVPNTYEIHEPGPLVLVIHGPNLQRLGHREPLIYGDTTYAELVSKIRTRALKNGIRTRFFQSDIEGELVSAVNHFAEIANGIIINPGAFTHTSIALRDALAGTKGPVIEVHISKVSEREQFRHESIVQEVADAFIEGLGTEGYFQAIDRLFKAFKS